MGNTLEILPLRDREVFYFRQRNKNRVFEKIITLFVEEAERRGVTKKQIADLLKKDTALITRWLSGPNNLTLDTISDILLALGAEMDYHAVRFDDRQTQNYFHPLMGLCPQERFRVTATGADVVTLPAGTPAMVEFRIGTATEAMPE